MKRSKKHFKILCGAVLFSVASLFITSCDPTITGDSTLLVNPDNGDDNGTGGKSETEEAVLNLVKIDFSVYGDNENSKLVNELLPKLGDLTFDWSGAKFYKTGFAARFYKGNTLKITSEKEISKIVMEFVSKKTGNNFSCNKEGFELNGTTGTWEGSATSITFSNGTSNNDQAHIKSIIITYSGEAATNGTGSGGGSGSGSGSGTDTGSGTDSTGDSFPEDTRDLSEYNVLNIDLAKEGKVSKFGDAVLTWAKGKGSNTPAENSQYGDVRLYKGNTLTISSEAEIAKIQIEFSKSHEGTITSDKETYYKSGNTGLWMGTANSVTFTNSGSSAYLKKIIITYKGAKYEVLEKPETKKESDWLFVYYYDADNNLNDELYANMREAEYSLAKLRNEDGSAKESHPSVNMVMFWDGLSSSGAKEYKSSYGQTIIYLHPNGALYELGADYNLDFHVYTEEEFGETNTYSVGCVYDTVNGSLKKNLFGDSYRVSDNTVEYKPSWVEKEPDMSDPATLKNYLKWVKENYSAKNVVICLSDHGAGTGKETYTDTTKSTKKSRSLHKVSRTLCYDDDSANSDRSLSCKNILDAFEYAGYTGDDKPAVIWMDVCLQSTVEIANLLADKADYLLASPNTSVSHEYSHAFTTFENTMTPETFGKKMVSEYYHNWLTEPYAYADDRTKTASMLTMSLIDLDSTKLNTLKTNIEAFADVLIAYSESDSSGFESMAETYITQGGNWEDLHGIAYEGTYSYLYDIGSLVTELSGVDALKTAMPGLETAAANVKTALSDVIVYSWGGKCGLEPVEGSEEGEWASVTDNQMYLTDGFDYLTGKTITVEKTGNFYGLTIVTQSVSTGISEYYTTSSSDDNMVENYYANTGYSEKWETLLKALPAIDFGDDDNGHVDWNDPSIWDDDEDEGDN